MDSQLDTVAILDTETSGLTDSDVAIEVAVIVYSVTHAAPIRSFSSLMRAASNPAERVNRIPSALLADAPEAGTVWAGVSRMVAKCDAVLAHNADFDRRFVPPDIAAKPWICTMNDLAWPMVDKPTNLAAVALAHGLGIASAHRAYTDCDTIARLLSRVAETMPLGPFLARGLRPKSRYQALVSFETNQLAKDAGFKWDGAAKMWARTMADEDAAALAFKVRRIDT